MEDLELNSVRRRIQYRTGWVEYDEFYPRLSKPIMDSIDKFWPITTDSLMKNSISSSTTTSNIAWATSCLTTKTTKPKMMNSDEMALVRPGDAGYPRQLLSAVSRAAAPTLACRGRPVWAGAPTLALFCSSKAPAGVLLAVHDLAQGWRHDGPLLMGGFQSLVEDEALTVLLRGPRPVAVWLARGMAARVRADFKPALAAGRLTLVAPFPDSVRRVTSETALMRNRWVAAAADTVLIAHAQAGSKTEALAREVSGWGRPVYTLDHPANVNLVQMGAKAYSSS